MTAVLSRQLIAIAIGRFAFIRTMITTMNQKLVRSSRDRFVYSRMSSFYYDRQREKLMKNRKSCCR
jgi:hypothetical protein